MRFEEKLIDAKNEGKAEGRVEGIGIGEVKGRNALILKMIENGYSDEEICRLSPETTAEDLERMRKQFAEVWSS